MCFADDVVKLVFGSVVVADGDGNEGKHLFELLGGADNGDEMFLHMVG